MNINLTKQAVKDSAALWHGGEGVKWLEANTIIRKWENIPPADVENAISYLQTYTSEKNGSIPSGSVTDLMVGKNQLDGIWRGGKITHKREDNGNFTVFQELHEGFVTTLGTGGAVDWSEFYILNERAFHANHQQPVLRLANVAPSAVHDLTAYLNQDSFEDITYRDDTLSGTWYRLPIRADVQEDGSYVIDVPLTDTLNETLYFSFMQSSKVRKGFLYRREATQASVDEVTDATWFDADGNKYTEAGTGRYRIGGQDTLPDGWTVVNRSTRRDDGNDLLWDLDIELTWTEQDSVESSPFGNYEVTTDVQQFTGASSLPTAADLASVIDIPGAYTASAGSETPVKGKLWVYGTKYYECIADGAEATLLTDTNYFTEHHDTSDTATNAFGLFAISKQLTGPGGAGSYQRNEDGTYNYAIVSTRVQVVDTAWHITKGPDIETERNQIKVGSGVQPIRQRLGGELAYEEDDRGNLVGIDWNLEWDDPENANGGVYPTATAPDNWVLNGYQSRYGNWRSYWTKGYFAGPVRGNWGGGKQFIGPHMTGTRYQIGDVIWAGSLATAFAMGEGDYAVGDVVTYGGNYYTCIVASGSDDHYPGTEDGNAYWSPGAFKVCTGATAWAQGGTSEQTIYTDGYNTVHDSGDPSSSYSEGNVRKSGTKIYTCGGKGPYLYEKYSLYAATGGVGYSTYATNGITLHFATNSSHPPESKFGQMFWQEGALDDALTALTWEYFSPDYVSAKIAIDGVGDAPFEQPDLHVPILQEVQDYASWNNHWEYQDDADYSAGGTVVFFLDNGLRYEAGGAGGNPAVGESPSDEPTKWTVTTDNPTAWSSSDLSRYGNWSPAWTKGYLIGAGSILSNSNGGIVCVGVYDADSMYQVGDVVATAASVSAPAFKVVTGASDQWEMTDYDTENDGAYEEGDVVESGGFVWTCKGDGNTLYETYPEYSYVGGSYVQSDTVNVYITNSTHPPHSPEGQNFWTKGASGTALYGTSWDNFATFDPSYVAAKVATAGLGSEPFETARKLSVYDEEGSAALSSGARYAFYNNFAVNPKISEGTRCIKQTVGAIELSTFFAFNPTRLAENYRRYLPADSVSMATVIEALHDGGYLPDGPNDARSNFKVAHLVEPYNRQSDVWVITRQIVVRGDLVTDAEAQQEFLSRLSGNMTGGIQGDIVVIKADFTGVGGDAWTQNFMDVS